jgi:N utilization substance protein A
LSLAIGRRGQNVRLASKLVGWDIEIMTHDELASGIERAEGWFRQIPGVADEMVEKFIEEGFLSYDDLTFLEAAQLGELIGVTEEVADDMILFAEEAAERVDEETKAAKALEAESPTPKPVPARSGVPTAADLFPEALSSESAEPKLTAEQLFGTDNADQEAGVSDQESGVSSQESEAGNLESGLSDQESGVKSQEAEVSGQESPLIIEEVNKEESGVVTEP